MIHQDTVQIRDAYGRHAYTGVFRRTWLSVGFTGVSVLIGMERLS